VVRRPPNQEEAMIARSFANLRLTALTVGALVIAFGAWPGMAAFSTPALAVSKFSSETSDPPSPIDDVALGSLGGIKTASGLICGPTQGPGSDAANVNTDCDEGVGNTAPHNEPSIAVNPANVDNLIAGANDYQFLLTNGGALKITALSRAHVSFDGGATWAMYAVPFEGYGITGDPAVAFDADGTAYYSILGAPVSQAISIEVNADVLVSRSHDGGKTWSIPVRVGQGVGSHAGVSKAREDKDYIAAWGHGNALVTWTNVTQGLHGSFLRFQIYDAVTHDGGTTWTKPAVVSASASFCMSAQGDKGCDADFAAVPVYAGGHTYVAFENFSQSSDGHDQYLVSEVSPQSGAIIAGPFQVAQLVDGNDAYPIDAEGRQTYEASQFRTWSVGDITADPTDAHHLAVVWSDMRNSTVPLPDLNPYDVSTNSDVVVSQSFDSGRTWSTPVALRIRNDQFMPWGAYDAAGLLRIGYFDRSYDAGNRKFGYSLATETVAGSLNFSYSQLTTKLSDPTTDNLWFSFIPVDPSFPRATFFIGDYSGIAAYSGGVVAVWTDLRNEAQFAGHKRFGQDVFFARST
jgi:hypothetical protein